MIKHFEGHYTTVNGKTVNYYLQIDAIIDLEGDTGLFKAYIHLYRYFDTLKDEVDYDTISIRSIPKEQYKRFKSFIVIT